MIATTINDAISERIRSNAFERGSAVGASSGGMTKTSLSLTYFRSLSGGVRCTLRSLHYQPIASDFTGSAFTCASWISLHSVHRSVSAAAANTARMYL